MGFAFGAVETFVDPMYSALVSLRRGSIVLDKPKVVDVMLSQEQLYGARKPFDGMSVERQLEFTTTTIRIFVSAEQVSNDVLRETPLRSSLLRLVAPPSKPKLLIVLDNP